MNMNMDAGGISCRIRRYHFIATVLLMEKVKHVKTLPLRKNIRKVNSDAAKKLYTRLNNAYQMRCSRAPFVYRVEDRFAWQDRVRQLLKEVEAGNLSYEDFAEVVRLPDTK